MKNKTIFPILLAQRAHLILSGLILALLLLCACQQAAPAFFYDFENPADLDRIQWKCGSFFKISRQHASHGNHSLQITMHPAQSGSGKRNRGITFVSFAPDWHGEKMVRFDIHNPQPVAIPLILRMDDGEDLPYPDRYNKSFTVLPGDNAFAFPLTGLLTSSGKRKLDLRHIRTVTIYHPDPGQQYTLYLDNLRFGP